MKKLLLLPLVFIGCGKYRSHDVTFYNTTSSDLYVDFGGYENGFSVNSYGGSEIISERPGTFTIHVHSKQYITDYTEVVTVGNEDLTVNLHK